jgi:hypothetical protein
MEFRIQIAIIAALWAAPALFAQKELRYQVRHDHWRKYGPGTLIVNERGISFQEAGKKDPHAGEWPYSDIQQLYLAPNKMKLLTYEDRKWRLGMDREYTFGLPAGQTFNEAYTFLKGRLDQRFVAAIADPEVQPLWRIPVKLLGRISGSEGVLEVSPDRIVYKTGRKERSRTWRYQDIENVSTSGPFQLTLTSFERAKSHYGNLKGFNFQLKEPLDEKRFNLLWRRLHQPQAPPVLTSQDAWR